MPALRIIGQEDLKNKDGNDCCQRAPCNENLKKHVAKVHKKEKLQKTIVVPNLNQNS